VVDRNTKLVEVSQVAMFTGFQHDPKAVCDLAHAHGALVYADIASALITFAMKDARPVQERLKRARVNARIGRNFIRLSPSVFNDMADIDRLLEALGG